MQSHSRTVYLVLLMLIYFCSPALEARQLVIYKSHDYISRNYEVQNFTDTLQLQAGQESLPLLMSIYNGSPEAPSFKWFRIIVNGVVLATEQDMRGKEAASKDISGSIQGNNLQVQVEAGGVPGANLWWTLSTGQAELSYASPQQVMQGQELKLCGSGFPSAASSIYVSMNGKQVPVLSASANAVV
ncbi:MAG: hypothetical protein K2X27_12335, partial [Candidatus Obscuribacterales bacterium]|nr:hypothetical protein [Candidatus Obscuribacterales bacterium]